MGGEYADSARRYRWAFFRTLDENVTIECCAKISDNEILFRSKDGQYYFSLCDGWGEENGTLYGLKLGIFHDFKHPQHLKQSQMNVKLLFAQIIPGAVQWHIKYERKA